MCTYNSLDRYFNWEQSMNTAGRNVGFAMCSKDILHRTRGIILIEFTKIRWFSRWSDGGGWSLLSEAKSLKTAQVRSSDSSDTKIRWFSWWPGRRLDRLPGGCSRAVSSQAKQRGTIRLVSTQIRCSRDSQAGGWTCCLVAKDAQVRVGKQL
jgi:hypothetical protein